MPHPIKRGWALQQILGSSISYRIAVGPQQGRKAFMIRTIRSHVRSRVRVITMLRGNADLTRLCASYQDPSKCHLIHLFMH